MKKTKAKPPKQIYLQRIKCNCVAQKHELINNCVSCGKVVCAQQGQGPCLYCGHIVTKPDGKFIPNDETLFPSLNKEQLNKVSQQRSRAIVHKNILLQRDKQKNMIDNIFDENIDYYDVSENQWLDDESRSNAIDKLLQKQQIVSSQKSKYRIVFDPLTGKFVTDSIEFDEQSFKQQGKKYMFEKQKQQYIRKMNKGKQNWDKRLQNNDKVKQIVSQLKSQNKKSINQNQYHFKNHVTQFIIEEQLENNQPSTK